MGGRRYVALPLPSSAFSEVLSPPYWLGNTAPYFFSSHLSKISTTISPPNNPQSYILYTLHPWRIFFARPDSRPKNDDDHHFSLILSSTFPMTLTVIEIKERQRASIFFDELYILLYATSINKSVPSRLPFAGLSGGHTLSMVHVCRPFTLVHLCHDL